MNKVNKKSIAAMFVVSLALLAFGLKGPAVALAATSPDLKTAATFSILAGAQITNTGLSVVSGNVGGPSVDGGWYAPPGPVTFGGTFYGPGGVLTQALSDRSDAYDALALNACGNGVPDWSGTTHDLAGATLPPGTYCATEFDLSGVLTLNGTASDVWIFKSTSSLVITGGATTKVVFTGGGNACNVWWRVVSSATFAGDSTLAGNILANTSVTFAAGASLDGRALARDAAVTLSTASITGPTCVAAPSSNSYNYNTITVIKQVINDNGGTAKFSDFPLFVNGNPIASGESRSLIEGTYTITETNLPNYKTTFAGDCDANGKIIHGGINTHNSVCFIINDDIGAPLTVPPVPPLIDVVKVPSPLSLPNGPGSVTYTYTLRNIGTVPVTDITMIGDTCSPIILTSGDTNKDSKLDVSETWKYNCSTALSETHTNTVVATGYANGLTAIDYASATVVVGVPIVPPLIHVVKKPSVFTLPAGGGAVTYTYTVTNPGTAPLSDVNITDDKCTGLPGRVTEHPGDLNKNNLLESNETWSFTCKTNLTKTTTNIGTAEGSANGLSVRDFSTANVVVASAVAPKKPAAIAPKLPKTGLPVGEENTPWNIVITFGVLALVAASLFAVIKKRAI